jgi:hypothetical protein
VIADADAEVLLESLAHRTLLLAIDGSDVGRGCITLMVGVIYKKRALPIAWIVVKGCKGHFPEETHIELVGRSLLLVCQTLPY